MNPYVFVPHKDAYFLQINTSYMSAFLKIYLVMFQLFIEIEKVYHVVLFSTAKFISNREEFTHVVLLNVLRPFNYSAGCR